MATEGHPLIWPHISGWPSVAISSGKNSFINSHGHMRISLEKINTLLVIRHTIKITEHYEQNSFVTTINNKTIIKK